MGSLKSWEGRGAHALLSKAHHRLVQGHSGCDANHRRRHQQEPEVMRKHITDRIVRCQNILSNEPSGARDTFFSNLGCAVN